MRIRMYCQRVTEEPLANNRGRRWTAEFTPAIDRPQPSDVFRRFADGKLVLANLDQKYFEPGRIYVLDLFTEPEESGT